MRTNNSNMDPRMEMTFRQRNAEENSYYAKFQACKTSWVKGGLWGILGGILCSLLFSGFELDEVFFGMLPITIISCGWTFATVLGMRRTAGFGLSCIPLGIFRCAFGIIGFFAGTYVLLWVAAVLAGIGLFAWILGFMLFAVLFPLETLYYFIRYTIEKNAIRLTVFSEALAA